MLNKINDLAKALPQPATLLTISKDLFDQFNQQLYPKERISTLNTSIPSVINRVNTENGTLDVVVIDDKVNFLQVT